MDGTAWTWVDDAILGLSYAVLDGPTESDAADQVRRSLDARSWHDLHQQLSAEDDWVEQMDLLYQLAIAAPAERVPVCRGGRWTIHRERPPTVRRPTYVAIRYLGWPDLTDHLRRAAVDESCLPQADEVSEHHCLESGCVLSPPDGRHRL